MTQSADNLTCQVYPYLAGYPGYEGRIGWTSLLSVDSMAKYPIDKVDVPAIPRRFDRMPHGPFDPGGCCAMSFGDRRVD